MSKSLGTELSFLRQEGMLILIIVLSQMGKEKSYAKAESEKYSNSDLFKYCIEINGL